MNIVLSALELIAYIIGLLAKLWLGTEGPVEFDRGKE